jgi:hypothetical protein
MSCTFGYTPTDASNERRVKHGVDVTGVRRGRQDSGPADSYSDFRAFTGSMRTAARAGK